VIVQQEPTDRSSLSWGMVHIWGRRQEGMQPIEEIGKWDYKSNYYVYSYISLR